MDDDYDAKEWKEWNELWKRDVLAGRDECTCLARRHCVISECELLGMVKDGSLVNVYEGKVETPITFLRNFLFVINSAWGAWALHNAKIEQLIKEHRAHHIQYTRSSPWIAVGESYVDEIILYRLTARGTAAS